VQSLSALNIVRVVKLTFVKMELCVYIFLNVINLVINFKSGY
jgi:hypothetical protein